MNTIDYFKLQAKNLHKDFKTKKAIFDNSNSHFHYEYTPKYFHVFDIVYDLDLDENKLNLMKAQHAIAQIAGFRKWSDLLNASEPVLEIAKILFDNQDVIDIRAWEDYIASVESMNQTTFDSETKLVICKEVFEMGIFDDSFSDYRIKDV